MKNSIAAIAASVICLCSAALATDAQGRVDFDGTKDGVKLTPVKPEGGSASNASWFKDQPERNQQYVAAYFPSGIDWRKSSVTVAPDKDGTVILMLKGSWDKDEGAQTWTLIDGVQAEGAEIKNGNFEDDAANWFLGGKTGEKAVISDVAKSGSKAIKVRHNSPAYQNLSVRAGQPFTISFWHKAAE